MSSFTFTIPASSGNMGPGFDCFGLALSLYNRFDMEWAEDYRIDYAQPHSEDMLVAAENHVIRSYERACELLGSKPTPFRLHCDNKIPHASGLGSSGTAALAGCAMAFFNGNKDYDSRELLQMVCRQEGHPDNVAASLYGGFVVCYVNGRGEMEAHRLPVSQELCCWILMPDLQIFTDDARRKMPSSIPRGDVVFNLSRSALTAVAFATGDYALLKKAVHDRVHEHQRDNSRLSYDTLKEALLPTNVFSVSLSGSGPAILVIAPTITAGQRRLVEEHFTRLKVRWQERLLHIDNRGMRYEEK